MDIVTPVVMGSLFTVLTALLAILGKAQFDGMNRQFDGMNRQFDGMSRQFDALRAEIGAIRTDVSEVRSEMAVMRSDLTHVALAVGARPQPQTG